MTDTELIYLPALRQLEMFCARDISPFEVLEAAFPLFDCATRRPQL